MPKNRWFRLAGSVAAIVLVVAAVVWAMAPEREAAQPSGRLAMAAPSGPPAVQGGEAADEPAASNQMMVILPDLIDLSQPLRDIPAVVTQHPQRLLEPQVPLPGRVSGQDTSVAVDPGLQNWHGATAMPAPIVNFAGTSNLNGVLPPDTQGDVGPNHYVQWVNLSFTIYNKVGAVVYGPANGNTLWTGFDTICANGNDGDPITIYDHIANRWMMSQFLLGATSYQCIAVSQTGDPTGSWYRYRYTWPNSYMNDYPHFGLWPDGYYLTVNQFNAAGTAWRGAGVAAFERDKMLTGLTAQMIYFDLYTVDSSWGGMLPSDLEVGDRPPVGDPNYFASWDDSTWIGPNDALRIWRFHVDWTTPGNSYFGTGAPGSAGGPNWTINTNNVDPDCYGFCADQPGTTVNLDPISDRLMHRLQYRRIGGIPRLLGNHTVDTNSTAHTAGIHWFELRNDGANWSMFQQGTYAPDTTASRWMGSIAMDKAGNIALGYSVSSASIYPSIRYAGRLAGDPLGTLPQSETTLIDGSGYQSSTSARWGDYSAMQLDDDGCTFWYTQEYIATSGNANWLTRVGSFAYPTSQCNPVELPTTNVYLPLVFRNFVPGGGPGGVLWDQPLSTVNQNAYVDQDFPDSATYSSYLADDFVNPSRVEHQHHLCPRRRVERLFLPVQRHGADLADLCRLRRRAVRQPVGRLLAGVDADTAAD